LAVKLVASPLFVRVRAALARVLLASLLAPLAASASESPAGPLLLAAAGPVPAASGGAGEGPPSVGALTLAAARARAIGSSPRLAGLAAQVGSRRALELQAGLLPNPEMAVEVENVGGSGDREAFEQTETTVWVSQLVPIAGKRGERRRVAALEGELAEWDLEEARRDVLADTTDAFIASLAAQERVALSRDLERLAAESVRAVSAEVRAGAASSVEQTRARIVATEVAIERAGTERALVASRTALAAIWNGDPTTVAEVRGDLADVRPPPPLAELEVALLRSPALSRWRTELAQRKASLALERARRVPDPTVRIGARHFHDNDDNALVFEVAVPLPIFDRNEGNVVAADHDVVRAKAERDAARAAAAAALAQEYADLARAYEETVLLRDRLLPDAAAAFAGIRDGYAAGGYSQLDLIAAQRTLFEVRSRLLDAEVAYHRAAADIERLTGRSLVSLEGPDGRAR
jgi:cobalt-zinc-cadmium efflux system outer membrane protein